MPKFAANISTLYREFPPRERILRAAAAGFEAVEMQFPYDQDPENLRAELDAQGLVLVLMNFPVGDLMRGGEGLASIPGREQDFEHALRLAADYAGILRPRAMNLLAGRPAPQHEREACQRVFVSNLEKAHRLTAELGAKLLIEPINTVDMPGFILSDSAQALELIAALPQLRLGLQYDLYHMHMMGEDLAARLPEIIGHIGHIQFSDAPGRTEPGLGHIDFAALFELIDSLDYDAWVGAEYFPSGATDDSLDWLAPWRRN